MAEGASNSSQAPLPAGVAGRIMDSMRALDLCLPPPQRQAGDVAGSIVDAFANSCDWSQLQQDLLVRIFSRLELPDLVYSGSVCLSWHLSYLATRRFRLCSPNQSPYLVYSSADRDSNTATLHNVSTNKVYHVSLPDPPFRSRYIVGSSHGWLVTADEHSNLQLLNPVTGVQFALPPPQSIKGVRQSFNSDGVLVGHYIDSLSVQYRCINYNEEPRFFPPDKTRHFLYQKAVLSSDPSAGNSTVLLRHRPWDNLSFARVGDTAWTWLDSMGRCELYNDFFFHGDDGLFYAIRKDGEIHTIDLNDPSPVVKVILNNLLRISCYTHYILLAPWGDLLQVRRLYGDPPSDDSDSGHEYQPYHELQGSLPDAHGSEEDDEETDSTRDSLAVYRVDLAEQKVTEIKDLQQLVSTIHS